MIKNNFERRRIKGAGPFFLLILSIFIIYNRAAAYSMHVPLSQADALLAEINSRRSANGLSPYTINPSLMAAAQAHSAYQASIGSATHSGADGSSPNNRAVAAGYGGGAGVSVSENIYSGMNASPASAVEWWINDGGWHLQGVLSTTYQDAGAGAATSGSVVYYTLDVGYISGAVPAPQPGVSNQSASANTTQAVVVKPMELSTPAADGSVTHIVQAGQTLWTIAAKYKLPLQDILTLNNFTENSFLHPGDKILIKGPGQSLPAAPELSPGISAEAGVQPSPTAVPPTQTAPPPTPAPSPTPTPKPVSSGVFDHWQSIAALFVGLVALIAVLALSLVRREE